MVLNSRTGALVILALAACKTTKGPDSSSSLRDETAISVLADPPYAGLAPVDTEAGNVWSNYCIGDQNDPAIIPGPNYATAAVQSAAAMLSSWAKHSFFLYGQINFHYKNSSVQRPNNVSETAHAFLVYLCGEFRDRPSMIAAKINWVNRTNYLATTSQPQIDPTREIWSQIVAASYRPYLELSDAYFREKRWEIDESGLDSKYTFGAIANIDKPVPALTVCETKFMFAEYIDEGKEWDSLDEFKQKYAAFSQNCSPDDLDYYYDFRGDSNVKPNSPESNGMIWHSISTAMQCNSTTKARTTPKTFPDGTTQKIVLTDADCASYFRQPFATRWNAARAGLGAWMLHSTDVAETFANTQATVTVIPAWGTPTTRHPHLYQTNFGMGQMLPGWERHWATADLGLSSLLTASNPGGDLKELTYERLRDAVDRHTDWYASGYNDAMSQRRERTQAYSPFVASSYEMSKSDMFTSPGFTVQSNDPEAQAYKHFMFIFKIHKDQWYSTADLNAGKSINFDSMWFDETSFGTTGLAKTERAWDRLGTPLEAELDSILYLHNICSNRRIQTADNPCYTPAPSPAGDDSGPVDAGVGILTEPTNPGQPPVNPSDTGNPPNPENPPVAP